MGRFRELNEFELNALGDEDLVAQLVAAREQGRYRQATDALRILVYRYERDVTAKVTNKVPHHEIDGVVADVFDAVVGKVFSAGEEPWKGEHLPSFKAWLFRITQFKIVDLLRGPHYGHHDPLVEEDDSDTVRGHELVGELDIEGAVEVSDVVERCMDELSEAHRLVIDLAIFGDLPSKEVADEVNSAHPELEPEMSASNVDKIKSRFRSCVKAQLGDSGEDD